MSINKSKQEVNSEEKSRAIEATILQIEKQHGKGSIMRLGADSLEAIPAISTGAISLDIALGIGGIPKGRITEVYGPESSGKTTIALHIIAEAQKKGGTAAFIDAEHALDPSYAKALGVDTDNLLVSQPDFGEQALDIAESLLRSSAIDVIVIDSVAALVPKPELDGEMGDAQMGLQARMMSKALRKLAGVISKTNTALIFINQIRHKIGVFFGSPETTSGGNALKFFASVRMDIRRIETLKQGDIPYGNVVRVKIVKNKVAPPFRKSEFQILFGKGISRESDLLQLAVDQDIVEKSGTWYSFNGERIGQGKENARVFFVNNPQATEEVERLVREKLTPKPEPASAAPEEPGSKPQPPQNSPAAAGAPQGPPRQGPPQGPPRPQPVR